MKKSLKSTSQTSAQIITKTFVRLFFMFVLLMGIIVSGVVALTSLQIRESEGASLLASVQEAAENGNINWKEFQLENHDEKGHAETFYRVTRPSGAQDKSHGTAAFLKEYRQWGNFSFSGDDIFWYTSSVASKSGIKVELWLNINLVIKAMMRAVLLIGLVVILLFFIARLMIRKASDAISKPLVDLTQVANQAEIKEFPVVENPKEVEQLSQSFNHLLQRLNQKIKKEQQFVSDASHELRTPVAAIRGHVTLLKRRWHDHPEIVDDSLAYIDEESMRMKHLIEELLDLSRESQLPSQKTTFKLTEFTDRLVSEIQPAFAQKITVEASSEVMVNTDQTALHHILLSLLENAGKYSPKESVIKVLITTHQQEIDLSVADEGSGIADSEKENIFERFYRIDKSRSSRIPGTGLGLAIARQYATRISAELFVSDNLPKGSIFHLVFKRD